MNRIAIFTLTLCLLAAAAPGQKKNEWGPGVPFHTKWDDAIKEVKATGKLLFIYNGWRDAGI